MTPTGGFFPEAGDEFVVVTAASVVGQFGSVTGPVEYSVTYNATYVTLNVVVPPTPGDLDGDCMVGIVDFLVLLANWGP